MRHLPNVSIVSAVLPLPRFSTGERGSRRSAFTIIELLVVIGIIAILLTLTLIAVGAIARDAKLSNARNQVLSALGAARALAMESGRPVMVSFHAAEDGPQQQVIEIQYSQWTDTAPALVNGTTLQVVDRFTPVANMEPVRLPRGIKIAGPLYGVRSASFDGDFIWHASSDVRRFIDPTQPQTPGRVFGVIFDHTGNVLTNNPYSDSNRVWVDLNNDGQQRINGTDLDPYYSSTNDPLDISGPNYGFLPTDFGWFFRQRAFDDENYITMAPFLAIYNDDNAREIMNPSTWGDPGDWESEISAYVNQFAERIHFNRYTGVVMR